MSAPGASSDKVQRGLLFSACAIEACCCYLVSRGDLQHQIGTLWAGVFPAFLCWVLAAYLVLRRGASPGRPHLILGAALVFRLTLWWSPATLSDDVFRYIWDGRVQLAGINPYLYAPSAPQVAHLRDALYPSVNHAAIPTIYPPLAQLFFRAICVFSATPAAFKLALLLCDWGLCLLLAHTLVRRGQDPRRVVLYAWNPLPLVEVAGSGHIDALGVLILFAALYALHSQRWAAAVCALAGAFLVKLVPLVLLPTFWRRPRAAWFNFRKRSALLLFPTLGLLAFWPFASAGEKLATGLLTYVQHWHFNAAAYSLFRFALQPWDDHAYAHARWLCTAFFALVALGVQIRYRDPYRAAFATLGAYVLLSPTVHPWYLLWVLPFLAFFPSPAWMLLSGLIFLAYEVQIGYGSSGVWREKPWVLWAQYAPFYLLLCGTELARRWGSRPRHGLYGPKAKR